MIGSDRAQGLQIRSNLAESPRIVYVLGLLIAQSSPHAPPGDQHVANQAIKFACAPCAMPEILLNVRSCGNLRARSRLLRFQSRHVMHEGIFEFA